MSFDFDPTTVAFQEDPLPLLRRLRDHHPVYYNERLRFWILTRWQDVYRAALDWQIFANDPVNYGERDDEPTELMPRSMMDFGIFYMDPPRHNRIRALLSKTFTPHRVAALEPTVRQLAQESLRGLAPKGRFELVHDYAAPLTTMVIGALIGVPEEERWQLRLWGEKIEQRDPSMPVEMAREEQVEAVQAFRSYLLRLVDQRRKKPEDDLLSALSQAEVDGDGLTDDELASLSYQLMIAGNETTAMLIGNGAIHLAEQPDQRRLLVEEPGLVPGAVEEMARYDPAALQSPPRITTRPVEMHGQQIPAREPVLLSWMGANHDERQFPDPDRFDVTRAMERHLGFGFGVHFCVGAALARLESRVAFEELLRVLPDYQLDGRPARWASTWLRSLGAVPITFDADEATVRVGG